MSYYAEYLDKLLTHIFVKIGDSILLKSIRSPYKIAENLPNFTIFLPSYYC